MIDERTRKLAKLVVNYSVRVSRGENVCISGSTEASEFISALYKEVILAGGHPVLRITLPGLAPFFYKYASKEQIEKFPEIFDYTVKKCQKYIGVNTEFNTRELTGIDASVISARKKVTAPISHYIMNEKGKIRRVTVGYPCPAYSQEAEMSLVDYENFVFNSCLQDWENIGNFIDRILARFKKGKQVHLIGENVDLEFDIKGKLAVADKGEENMPGGEIFMAPVKNSVNGWIKFEYPAIEQGNEVQGISLKFENGKVIESKAEKGEEFLKKMIETDENAGYIGEFGIGMNPKITRYTKNLLFDEKISGTIHLALGMAYKDNGGGNDSAIHWDIVKSMKKAKIILDGKVVQENGEWVI